jgi:diaminopimelate epimerase
MMLEFTKMHGLGNDFIVFEVQGAATVPDAAQLRRLADRHTGIGFDQALVITPRRRDGTLAFYRIFNADGGEVEQCGNGARCIAEWLRLAGRGGSGEFTLDSPGGLVAAQLREPGVVAVDMGVPDFAPRALPFTATAEASSYSLDAAGQRVEFGAVSMGNPHIVISVPDVAQASVATLGPALESHPAFPRRVNVGFMQVLDATHILLRVFERGVGETRACGTGACAAVAVGRKAGRLAGQVEVGLPGGALSIAWPGPGAHLWMTGPAEVSFRGRIEI